MVRASFKPEFLNRLDDLVVFSALSKEELARIAELQIDRLAKRLAERRLTLEVTPEALAWLADEGNDPAYGARPLRRLVQTAIGDRLAKEILAGEVKDGDTVRVDRVRRRPDRGPADRARRGSRPRRRLDRGALVRTRLRPTHEVGTSDSLSVPERARVRGCHARARHGGGWREPYEGKSTVTIDPSSIPNFGGQPEPQAAGPAGPVVPDQDLVKQLLDQMELKYVVDDEGDLAAPWEEFRTYFMFRGEDDQQVFSVRTFYDRPHADRGQAQAPRAIDDWNRRTLWPKVYSHTHETTAPPSASSARRRC